MGRPDVRVNQLGYLPDGPKRAVWVTDTTEPADFAVRGAGFAGRTRPWPVRPDPASGLNLHTIDFTDLRTTGDGFVVEVAGARSHPFAIAPDLYRGLAHDALGFFYLQRSGCAIDEARAPRYVDEPTSETTNDVCIRWNAPLVWLSAFVSSGISSRARRH